ncbi:MAG: PD-(D/E)XK nuclease family protein [Muribaculaceae bacterium]|nr:PD-(D/E)XK nuclease family protein [Muribaculaceae bacterium]
MASRKFLEQVADYYAMQAQRIRLEDYVFVFPNRRSGRFLKRYLQQRIIGTSFMPRFITMGAFVARMADVAEASETECLFELYDAYRETIAERGGTYHARDFDKFIFWGEIILSDFNEIDRNCVNAQELYSNLGRLHEISADFLSDEQKEVVHEIWGENTLPDSIGRFWRHLENREHDSDECMASRFLSLWDMLADIYMRFIDKMGLRKMATSGMQHREALRRLKTLGRELIENNRYVFVGFNAPDVSDVLIFSQLHKLGAAEFFWDTSSPYIKGEDGNMSRDNSAFAMLGRLAKRFSSPDDFTQDKIETLPQIDVVGIPSCTAQTKMACEILVQWMKQGIVDVHDAIETAIILPDESLLMPLLHSIPQDLEAVNITMGLPFRGTAFAALLSSVISMQMRARKIRGIWRFFHEDIIEVLSHPHLRRIAPNESIELKKHIIANNLYTMSADDLATIAPRLSFIFSAVEDARRIGGVRAYLSGLISGLHIMLAEKSGHKASWELEILEYLHKKIEELAALVERHNVDAGEKSYFTFFERAMHSRTINMAGTPLKGLQIMNVAETRGLDFDNLIILSMNDRIFPKRGGIKTMIPNNLRSGYGLPPIDRDENDASYYFYRLIARASHVALIYDSRDASAGTGEPSRFITQLRYLHPHGNMRIRTISTGANPPEKRSIQVVKTPEILDRLKRFLPGGDACISASALKTFKHCPLKFFLQYVCGFRSEDEVTEYITSAVYGTILHAAAQAIYDDYKDRPINAAILSGLASHISERYAPLVESLIHKEYYHHEAAPGTELPVEGQIVRDLILDFLSAMFNHERAAWCPTATDSYIYREGEMRVEGPWQITPDLTINFKMYIDRVDETSEGLRFIDYKTGSDRTETTNIASLFKPDDTSCDAILQILAYCEAFAAMKGEKRPIQPMLYTFRDMEVNGGLTPLRIGGEDIVDYRQISDDFMPELQKLVISIFDAETPFIQACEGARTCSYCIFAPMCGRVPRTDE